jgi:hypothetical protein
MANLIFHEDDIQVGMWPEAGMVVFMTDKVEVIDKLIANWNASIYGDMLAYSNLLITRSGWPLTEVDGKEFWTFAVAFNTGDGSGLHKGVVGHIWNTIDEEGILFYSLMQIRSMAGMVLVTPVLSTVTSVIGLDCDPELVLPFTGGLKVVTVRQEGEQGGEQEV